MPTRAQKSAVMADSVSPAASLRERSHSQVAVAELKPGLAAQLRQHLHEVPGFVGTSPAQLRVVQTGKRVHDGIEVGTDGEAQVLEVVTDIHHDRELVGAGDLDQSLAEPRATHAA
jgi:hypothetical protein